MWPDNVYCIWIDYFYLARYGKITYYASDLKEIFCTIAAPSLLFEVKFQNLPNRHNQYYIVIFMCIIVIIIMSAIHEISILEDDMLSLREFLIRQ